MISRQQRQLDVDNYKLPELFVVPPESNFYELFNDIEQQLDADYLAGTTTRLSAAIQVLVSMVEAFHELDTATCSKAVEIHHAHCLNIKASTFAHRLLNTIELQPIHDQYLELLATDPESTLHPLLRQYVQYVQLDDTLPEFELSTLTAQVSSSADVDNIIKQAVGLGIIDGDVDNWKWIEPMPRQLHD